MSWFSRRANLTNWPEPGHGHSLKNTDAQSKTYLRRNGFCFSGQSRPQKQNPSKRGQHPSAMHIFRTGAYAQMLLRCHSLGGAGKAFPWSRHFQSRDHGQRGPAKRLGAHNSDRNPWRPQRRRHTLDFLLMFCGGKAADCIAAVTMTTRWAIRAPFGI
jgi:hypothetical protein